MKVIESFARPGHTALTYGLQPGHVLRYRVQVHATRSADGAPGFHRRSVQEAESALRIKAVGVDPEDGGLCLVLSQETAHHRVDGMARAPEPRRLVYLKQDAWGRPLETTDPSGAGAPLLLPTDPVAEGSEWVQVETRTLPDTGARVEVRTRFRVAELTESQALLDFQGEEAEFEDGSGGRHRVSSRGAAAFDLALGVLTSWREETRMQALEGDLLTEVTSLTEMDLEAAEYLG